MMQLELNETERRAVLGALEAYRRIKGAEGKLSEHRALKDSEASAQAVKARYQALSACVEGLQKRLST